MVLKTQLENLDGLPPELASEYKKVTLDDGAIVYRLDTEPVDGWQLADTRALTKSLEKERMNGRVLRQYREAFPTVEDAREAAEKVTELSGEVEALRSRKGSDGKLSDAERKELERVHKEALEGERTKAERYRKQLQKRLGRDEARLGLREAGFGQAAEVLDDKLLQHVAFSEDDDGNVVSFIANEDGGPRLVTDESGKARQMTLRDRALEMAKDPSWKRFLDAGTPPKDEVSTPPRTGVRPATTAPPSEGDNLRPTERLKRARQAQRTQSGA